MLVDSNKPAKGGKVAPPRGGQGGAKPKSTGVKERGKSSVLEVEGGNSAMGMTMGAFGDRGRKSLHQTAFN